MLQHKFIAGVTATTALAIVALSPINTYATGESAAVESVVNSLKTTHQTTIDAYNASNADIQLQLVDGTDCYGPFYKSSSMKTYTQVDNALCFETQTTDNVSADLTSPSPMIDTLTSSGFTMYGSGYVWPVYKQYLNETTGVICSVAESGANCGHISQQVITDKWAEYLNGIGAAYYAANQEYPVVIADLDFSNDNTSPTINDSDYESYQYTSIGIQNTIGLFYRSSPTSDWVYFTSAQDVIDCNKYSGEIQKGFAGYDCYDVATNTVVKVSVADDQTPSSDSSALGVPDTGVSTDDDSLAVGTEKVLAVIAGTVIVATLSIITARRLQRRHDVRTFSRK